MWHIHRNAGIALGAMALFVSTLTYYQARRSNSADVTVRSQSPRTFWLCNRGQERWTFIALLPINVINNGSQPTSLLRLRDNQKFSPVRASRGKGKSRPVGVVLFFPKTMGQDLRDFDGVLPEDLEDKFRQERRVLVNYEGVPQNIAIDFDQNLPVGQSVPMVMGLWADSVESIKIFDIDFTFEFAYGRTIKFGTSIEVPPPSGGEKCP